jgi:hypothetical protein
MNFRLVSLLSFLLFESCHTHHDNTINQNSFIKMDQTSSFSIPYYQEENGSIFDEIAKLESNDTISFGLNSTTIFNSESISILEKKGKTYFTMTNALTNQLLIYDLNTRNIPEKIIQLNTDSENGVGKLSSWHFHHIINFDSIFLYNQRTGTIYLFNENGNILNKTFVADLEDKNREYGSPRPSASAPIIKIDHYLYIPCQSNPTLENYKNQKMILRYNIKTHDFTYLRKPHYIFENAFWGSNFLYNLSIAKHTNTNKLVLGYAIDPHIYLTDLNGSFEESFFVGSKHFKEINPLGLPPNNNFKQYSTSQIQKHHKNTPQYLGIIHDPYRKVYYRIGIIRSNQNLFDHNYIIIITDEEFNKIGELKLPYSKYALHKMHFITANGLYIARKDFYEQNNGQIVFESFHIKFK